jgi:hypothetical protein
MAGGGRAVTLANLAGWRREGLLPPLEREMSLLGGTQNSGPCQCGLRFSASIWAPGSGGLDAVAIRVFGTAAAVAPRLVLSQ